MPLQIGKTPIVVPRQYKFGEHVNDHQVAFVKEVANRMGTIIAVTDIEKLEDTINSYDSIIREMHGNTSSNNAKFNNELENIVKDMFKEKFDD
ncbi:glycosyltransferase [Faecalibacterium prausnitzii]|uniref:Glycosyltransferase n=2 Tax=Faecalibacterium prausnitzii TaxID=853 RepID=A0A6G1ZWS1_9FIRM|nr:glycosyltransferase [Faecalibacterium prausnitzii]MSC89997.1 glycosyltransferase [Faecalibacterium prausnitzii]